MGGHLVLGEAGLEEPHRLPVGGIADGPDDPQALLLVLVLDGAGLHHRRHAVGPRELRIPELVDHVDVDEVHAQRLVGHLVAVHLLDDGVGELLHLLSRRRSRRTLDPRVRVADVLLRNPGRVALDLKPDVALLEQHGRAVAAEQRVTQSGLEPVPARRERARHVAHVLVVHQQQRAQVVGLHPFARALQPILAQTVPVDALLPVHPRDAEVRHGVPLAYRPFSVSMTLTTTARSSPPWPARCTVA